MVKTAQAAVDNRCRSEWPEWPALDTYDMLSRDNMGHVIGRDPRALNQEMN